MRATCVCAIDGVSLFGRVDVPVCVCVLDSGVLNFSMHSCIINHCSHIPTVSIQPTLLVLSSIKPSSRWHHHQEPRRQYIHPRATSSVAYSYMCVTACMHVRICACACAINYTITSIQISARSLCDVRLHSTYVETRGCAAHPGVWWHQPVDQSKSRLGVQSAECRVQKCRVQCRFCDGVCTRRR